MIQKERGVSSIMANEDKDNYWQEYLAGYECCASVSIRCPDSIPSETDAESEYILVFDKIIYGQMKDFAKTNSMELSVLFNAMWGFLSERYHNKKDIVFGNRFINDSTSHLKPMTKIVPVRVNSTQDESVIHVLEQVARIHQQHIDSPALSDSQLSWLNGGLITHCPAGDVCLQDREYSYATGCGIELTVFYDDELTLAFRYRESIYSRSIIEGMVNHLERIAVQMIQNPLQKLSQIELLTEEEKLELVREYRAEGVAPNESIIAIFRKAVRQHPDHPAIKMGKRVVTYSQLDKLSDVIAAVLRTRGIPKQSIIAIMADRKIETIIGIIGILKADCAYLPIDPECPRERKEHILQDAQVNTMLTANTSYENIPSHITIIDLCEPYCDIQDEERREETGSSDSLAYVMYTSGTTGMPKGVMIEHQSVIRLVRNTNFITFYEQDRVLQTSSIVFDASTLEIWGALLNGSTLHLIHKPDLLNIQKLKSIIQHEKISVMFLASALFQQISEADITVLKPLRVLVVGGDAMSSKQAERVIHTYPELQLINGYGPTENTTFSTTFLVDKPYCSDIPIGKPIANSSAYIIDCFGNLQACGLPGELYVGGAGVAKGYLNKDELTDEKFVELPSIVAGRLYKTGDIVRLDSDGNIRFMGRRDGQVKIRGFRVELSEIKNRLLAHTHVNDAFIMINQHQSNDKCLCTYFTADKLLDSSEVRDYLGQFLPDYMIPTYIFQLHSFPLTVNGKIDKEALPAPTGGQENMVEAPANLAEQSLLELWKTILHRDGIGVNDNFFHIGGDSLKAMSFIAAAEKIGFAYSISDVYSHPSIRELLIRGSTSNKIPSISISEPVRLSFAQEGIWFNSKIEPIYNVVLSVSIRNPVDFHLLRQAIHWVVSDNQELRTIIVEQDYVPYQKIYEEVMVDLTYEKHEDKSEAELRRWFEHEETYRVYELDQAPLFHFRLGESMEGINIFTIGTHHVLADAYTINILLAEIDEKYNMLLTGTVLPLYQPKTTCADYAVWQRQQYENEAYEADIPYWIRLLNEDIVKIEFPEHPSSSYGKYEGGGASISIPHDTMTRFEALCSANNLSRFAGYTTIFYMFLNYIFDIEDIAIGTASAGRDRGEIQHTMGNFAYASLLRARISNEDSFVETADKVRASIHEVNRHQTLPYEMWLKQLNADSCLYKLPYRILIEYISNDKKADTLGFSVADYSNELTPAEFTFFIQSEADRDYLHFYYRKNMFDAEEIQDFVYLLEDIFTEAVLDPNKPFTSYQL
ncbi:amino acid adenylation domain-containing protein [Paenibacillus sp. MER 180]|uniref:amino acid adenylation domain-containing protein n=1 Tax=Paenibacillus sp. MER 180 TaxID=2939570 RepID=UPI00203D9A96|nr:amino acid adenylation domain-containing protein [Paenibacillus sp. MER 180]MCM3291427.1 amino acid adenylation domain-containing protein [Paenibacillus sp. MER 180]